MRNFPPTWNRGPVVTRTKDFVERARVFCTSTAITDASYTPAREKSHAPFSPADLFPRKKREMIYNTHYRPNWSHKLTTTQTPFSWEAKGCSVRTHQPLQVERLREGQRTFRRQYVNCVRALWWVRTICSVQAVRMGDAR